MTFFELLVAANKPCQTRKRLLCQDDLCKYWQYTCQAQSGNPPLKGNGWVQVSHEKCHIRFLSATVVPASGRYYVSAHCGSYIRHVGCLKHMNSQIVGVDSISSCCQKFGSWLVSFHCWHEGEWECLCVAHAYTCVWDGFFHLHPCVQVKWSTIYHFNLMEWTVLAFCFTQETHVSTLYGYGCVSAQFGPLISCLAEQREITLCARDLATIYKTICLKKKITN